jgi:hypothetical protein
MKQCNMMFRPQTVQQLYTTTPHILPNVVVFRLPKNHWHLLIYWLWPDSTNYHFLSLGSADFILLCFLMQVDLHVCIAIMICIGVVSLLSAGQSASSDSWYIEHTILTDWLGSINITLTTIISTEWPSYPLSNPHTSAKRNSIDGSLQDHVWGSRV